MRLLCLASLVERYLEATASPQERVVDTLNTNEYSETPLIPYFAIIDKFKRHYLHQPNDAITKTSHASELRSLRIGLLPQSIPVIALEMLDNLPVRGQSIPKGHMVQRLDEVRCTNTAKFRV